MELKVIGKIRTDFPEKFGVPRQSGLVKELTGKIIFQPEYRNEQALRGLDGYDYLWILWRFDIEKKDEFVPMVKPPRLGGNTRMGVFATRSPFRPNPIGMSCVKIEEIVMEGEDAPYVIVSGIDMVDGTCIYDIKPYIAYTDSHDGARSGFADDVYEHELNIIFKDELLIKIDKDKREQVIKVLSQDPRPGYTHADSEREYGMSFGRYNIRFRVEGTTLTVVKVEDEEDCNWNTGSR